MRPEERAAILIEGLPYIKEYAGKLLLSNTAATQ